MNKISFAIKYNSRFRYIKEVDEIIIPYTAKATETELIDFIEKTFNKNQKLIVEIENSNLEKIIPSIRFLRANGWNIFLLISYDRNFIKNINDIPFFFKEFPKTIEEVVSFILAGASEIYITENLGFRMKDLKQIKDKFGIKFRTFPNIAQCSHYAKAWISSMQKFFIRPEDIEIYASYIDTFEILGGIDNSRLSVAYEIYKQEQWLGNLNDLILDFNSGNENSPIVPNTGMNPHFAEMRLNCGKACLYSSCNLCNEMGNLAQKFSEVGIEVIKPRKKPERTEEEKQVILDRLKGENYGSGSDEETVHPK